MPRRHKLLLIVVFLALAAETWPGYLLADRLEPYILGLPFDFAWLVLWIVVVFAALVLTFRADMRAAGRSKPAGEAGRDG